MILRKVTTFFLTTFILLNVTKVNAATLDENMMRPKLNISSHTLHRSRPFVHFTGTVDPSAKVVVKINDRKEKYTTVTANKNGKFSVDVIVKGAQGKKHTIKFFAKDEELDTKSETTEVTVVNDNDFTALDHYGEIIDECTMNGTVYARVAGATVTTWIANAEGEPIGLYSTTTSASDGSFHAIVPNNSEVVIRAEYADYEGDEVAWTMPENVDAYTQLYLCSDLLGAGHDD